MRARPARRRGINRLLSQLHASHTAAFTPDDLDYWG
jgi:hypothetical protein